VDLSLKARQIAAVLAAIVVMLTAASIASHVALDPSSPSSLYYDRLFSVDREANVPTFFSTFLLLSCAFLFWCVARANKGGSMFRQWAGLSVIFLYLALDEALKFHEALNDVIGAHFHTSGFLLWVWVVPYGIAVAVLFAVYLKFLFNLSSFTRNAMIAAAVVFLTGALGFEMLQARHFETWERDAIYHAMVAAEEFCEMSGVVLLIYALLDHIENNLGNTRVRFSIEARRGMYVARSGIERRGALASSALAAASLQKPG
jgi:hypothetical protein